MAGRGIKTTGQLRSYLAHQLERLDKGEITTDQVRTACKAASHINESLYAEVKIKAVSASLGETTPSLGHLGIGESAAENAEAHA